MTDRFLLAASDRLLVSVEDFYHVDPKGVRDINEFGEVETVLAGFIGNDERFRPLEANRELRRGGRSLACRMLARISPRMVSRDLFSGTKFMTCNLCSGRRTVQRSAGSRNNC